MCEHACVLCTCSAGRGYILFRRCFCLSHTPGQTPWCSVPHHTCNTRAAHTPTLTLGIHQVIKTQPCGCCVLTNPLLPRLLSHQIIKNFIPIKYVEPGAKQCLTKREWMAHLYFKCDVQLQLPSIHLSCQKNVCFCSYGQKVCVMSQWKNKIYFKEKIADWCYHKETASAHFSK